jgi:hypothetical protein
MTKENVMSLLTPEDFEALVANAQMRAKKETTGKGFDPYPVVKLYTPDRAALEGSCYV